MCASAKAMIAGQEANAVKEAHGIDAALKSIPAKLKADIGKAIGTPIDVGFAGVVGKSFEAIIEALTSGSLVQKAQGLIGFTDGYLIPKLMDGTGEVFKIAQAHLKEVEPKLNLLELIEKAKGKSLKEQKAILLTSTEFQGLIKQYEEEGKALTAKRAEAKKKETGDPNADLNDDAKTKGMDTKMAQQPIENLSEDELDFLAQSGQPKVDLSKCKTKKGKIKKLKAAGITTSKAPGVQKHKDGQPQLDKQGKKDMEGGGMVDATSIVKAIEGVTVESKKFIEGKLENIVDPKHSWIMDANKAKAPLKAGISGTTARFAGAAKLLGGTTNGAVCVMLGHLQKIEAHSFWEIVAGAGLTMAAGHYTPFPPNEAGMESAAEEFVKTERPEVSGTTDKGKAKDELLGKA
jgi:hypothetical protein